MSGEAKMVAVTVAQDLSELHWGLRRYCREIMLATQGMISSLKGYDSEISASEVVFDPEEVLPLLMKENF